MDISVYNNNKHLKAAGVKIPFTEHQVSEYMKCAEDPLYFIENYAKIVSLDHGVVPFKMFDYQKDLILAIHENRNVIGLWPRQFGKSTSVGAYIAWYILFNDNKTAVILANKQAIAIEIFGRVQFIIENLPKWLQQGVMEWNKKSLVLENGSKCIAAATSPSAVRGLSVNLLMCVDGSTEITIRNKKTGEIRQIPIEALETYDDMNDWQVLTDYGWSDFEGLKISTSKHKLLVKTEANELRCSLSHRIMTPRGWVEARKLKPTDKCKTIHGLCSVISITLIEGHTKLYDLIGVEKGSRYYTNDIVSHNCDEFAHLGPNLADEFIASVFPTLSSSETSKLAIVSTPKGLNHYHKMWVEAESGTNGFIPIKASWQDHPLRTPEWAEEQRKKLGDVRYRQEVEVEFQGSSYTLVDGTKLANLPISQPIHETDQLEVFAAPEKDHSYVMTVDVSRGRHLDYSAFTVFDVTEMPYKVVATFKDNTISTLEYPHLVYNTARQYNNAFVLIEVNDLGEEVSNTIWYEYEYENLYFTDKDRLTEARGYPGVRTTKKVKSVGCSVLKELIEKDQLIVNSHKIIEELGVFVLKRNSYAADDTSINDDLCTTLWLFAWLTKQDIFQETTNNNLRKALADKKNAYIDSTMTPYGFYDNGINNSQSKIAEDNKRLPDKSDPYFLTDDQIELLNW